MKLTIKNPTTFIVSSVLNPSTIGTYIFFVGILYFPSMIFPILLWEDSSNIWASSLIASMLLSTLYLVYKLVDAYLFARSTYIKCDENGLEVEAKSFNKVSFSIPINQVSNISVNQSFVQRLLNLATLTINHENLVSQIRGFDYEESKTFISDFQNKYHLDVKIK